MYVVWIKHDVWTPGRSWEIISVDCHTLNENLKGFVFFFCWDYKDDK